VSHGRAVLVTGAGGGLGRAISLAFAEAGFHVGVNYAHSEGDAQRTAEAVRACGAEAHLVRADVTDDQAVRGMLADVVARFGGLDVLVNNAGTTRYVPLADLEAVDDELWDRLLAINLKGPFSCARAAAPHLKQRQGSIVNVSSNSALRPTGSSIPYMASKAGLIMLTKCLAEALGPAVRANAVAPGWLLTPWVDKYVPDAQRARLFAEGAPRPADVKDVARAVVFLAETPSINGQTLIIDRGQVLI
jgi:3-oxoacyl-[acyl-carrier protein] reductase